MKSFREFLLEVEAATTPGTYACLVVSEDSKTKLANWLENNGVQNLVDKDEYHCTLIYSKKEVVGADKILEEQVELPVTATPKNWNIFGEKKLLVLELSCPDAEDMESVLRDMGAISDFPDYKPHISVALDCSEDTIPENLPDFEINFSGYKCEALDAEFEYVAKDEEE